MHVFFLPPSPECIIFDIDSTLYENAAYQRAQVDCQIDYFASSRGVSREEADRMIEEARIAYAEGRGENRLPRGGETRAKASLGNALSLLGVPIEESVRWRKKLLHPELFLTRDEKLRRTLGALAERFSFCVVTNNPVEVGERTLATIGVLEFFPRIIGLDTFMRSKPCRTVFAEAARMCGVEVRRCVSVGDRFEIDIALPLEMGMGGVLVDGVRDVYRLPDVL